MSRLRNVEDTVYPILVRDERARYDDNYLFVQVVKTLGFDVTLPFETLMLTKGFPMYESVRRVRQKIQEKHPELKPDEVRQLRRAVRESEYLEYVRG